MTTITPAIDPIRAQNIRENGGYLVLRTPMKQRHLEPTPVGVAHKRSEADALLQRVAERDADAVEGATVQRLHSNFVRVLAPAHDVAFEYFWTQYI